MQIILWLAIAALLGFWIFWPSGGRRPPVLLVVRNRREEVEGVVRMLRSAGHEVLTLDRGSTDGTEEVLRRLARDGAAIACDYGGIDEAVRAAQSPALLLVRLDEGFDASDALGSLRIGR